VKRVVIIIGVLMIPVLLNAQRRFDLGIFSGGSYYLGDINQSRHIYAPSVAIGGFYRYNINPRYSIRGNVYYGGLKGNPLDFDNVFYEWREEDPFKSSILDVTLQFEFNFLPYTTIAKKWEYSPYVSGGIGFSFINSASASKYDVAIPFGVGFKVNISGKLSAGMEWSFRKTFNDDLDGLENWNAPDYRFVLHNYDWYSFTGIFVTYKIFTYRYDCPAYWDDNLKNKWRSKMR
jgi:hypothetical protein